MKIQILKEGSDDDLLVFEVDRDLTITQVLEFIFGNSGNTQKRGSLFMNGSQIMEASRKLSSFGSLDTEILVYREPRIPESSNDRNGSLFSDWIRRLGTDGNRAREMLLKDPEMLQEFMEQESELAEKVLGEDFEGFERSFNDWVRSRGDLKISYETSNPSSKDETISQEGGPPRHRNAQELERRLKEFTRMHRVQTNMELALEHMPESFIQVPMLFIDCEVNDHHVKAFVDSGAQATIMSMDCAKRCHLESLLDHRFMGVAKGVGSAEILGRIHLAQMKVGRSYLPCTFTILKDLPFDVLFGLDMLRRHRCIIDLASGVLRVGEDSTPFLSERDIPDTMHPSHGVSSSSVLTPIPGTISGSGSPNLVPQVTFPERDIQILVNLGVHRDEAVSMLRQTNGNVELAASLLF